MKISDNEIEFMTGSADPKEGILKIQEEYHIPVAFATMGRAGSAACPDGKLVSCAAFLMEDTMETTGAGDTFMGCILSGILGHGIGGLAEGRLEALCAVRQCGRRAHHGQAGRAPCNADGAGDQKPAHAQGRGRAMNEYEKFQKPGIRENATLPSMEQFFGGNKIVTAGRISLGVVEIPLAQVAGTYTASRSGCFSKSFYPLLDKKSEFAAKWEALC